MFHDTTLKNKTGKQYIESEHSEGMILEGLELDGYYKRYYEGAEYPQKSYVSPEGMFACNQIKRLFITGIRTLSFWSIFIGPRKLIEAFNDISMKIFSPYIRDYYNRTPVAQEVFSISNDFCFFLGLSMENSKTFADILSMFVEYDLSYTYRVQDIASETSKERLLSNPRKEIKRLLALLVERDNKVVSDKFKVLLSLLSWALIIPKVRRAFRETVEIMAIDKLQFDEGDRYWASLRTDYKFEGLSVEERQARYKSWPKQVKI